MSNLLGLGLTVLAIAVAGTGSAYAESTDPCMDLADFSNPNRNGISAQDQLDFLLRAHYPPASFTAAQQDAYLDHVSHLINTNRAALKAEFDALQDFEKQCLDSMYPPGEQHDLRYLALQDSDADGIKDYRINIYGEFIENDGDIDNDGVLNSFDLTPFDADKSPLEDGYADADGDTLPDHLDWSNAEFYRVNQASQQIQADLYIDFGIMLVEGNQRFAPAAVEVVDDVFRRALHSQKSAFTDRHAIRTVFSTKSDYIFADDAGYGEVPAGSQRMYLYEPMFDVFSEPRNKMVAFLTVLHEAVHGIQYVMDIPADQHSMLRANEHTQASNFVDMMNTLGWDMNVDVHKPQRDLIYRGFVFNQQESTAFLERLGSLDNATTIQELQMRYAQLQLQQENDTSGRALLPEDQLPVQFGVFNRYSLDNAWEWHAEYVTASVLSRMYSYLEKNSSTEEYSRLHSCIETNLLENYFEPDMYKLQYASSDFLQTLATYIPISDEDLGYLANKYIVNLFGADEVCTS